MKYRNKLTGQIVDVPDAPMAAAAPAAQTYTPPEPKRPPSTLDLAERPEYKPAPTDVLGSAMSLVGKGAKLLFPEMAKMPQTLVSGVKRQMTQPYGESVKENMRNAAAMVGGPITGTIFGTPDLKQTLAAGAEVAPMFMGGVSPSGFQAISGAIGPKAAGTLFKGAGAIAPRTIGMVSGGLRAAFEPTQPIIGKDIPETVANVGKRAASTALSAGIGLGTGAAIEKAQEIAQHITKGILGQGKTMIKRLFRFPSEQLQGFEKNTGWDAGEQILKRDGANIKGMDYAQLQKYFEGKSAAANQAVDKLLEKNTTGVPRDYFVKVVQDQIDALKPKEGNILQDSAISALEKIRDDFAKNPPVIHPVIVNKLKRQLWDASSAAMKPNGGGSIAAQAARETGTTVMKTLEAIQPAVRDMNKETQLYWLAKEAITDAADRIEKSYASDWVSKLTSGIFPAIGGLAGYQIGSSGGRGTEYGLGGAAIGAGGLGMLYKQPWFQTFVANAMQKGLDLTSAKGVQMVNDIIARGGAYVGGAVAPKASEAIMRKMGIGAGPSTQAPVAPAMAGQAFPTPEGTTYSPTQRLAGGGE